MRNNKYLLKAITLFEVLITFALIGIMFMLVLPNQASNVAKAKALEAQSMLNHVYSLEKNYFYMYSKYSADLEEIGFEQALLVTEGGTANYKIVVESASATSFVISAQAMVDFDADGTLNVWQIDQDKILKETVKD
ncbi:MAG: type II secretion system protein [Putridiphycobacter sp.]